MSKYDALWTYIQSQEGNALCMSFSEIEKAAGVPLDHSFLNAKKELMEYGYRVKKISMKEQTVLFERMEIIQNADRL